MERLPEDKILEYNPDTLVAVRKLYNLDKHGQMDEAIDLLDSWVKKQSHFVIKEFSREYLERVIILVKGSVERAKAQLENICTLRTMLPEFFNNYENPKAQFKCLEGIALTTLLPKLTKTHQRLFVIKFYPSKQFSSKLFLQLHYFVAMICEYLKLHDYSDGIITILDYMDVNIMDFVSASNLMDMKQISSIFTEAYATRAKKTLILSKSKTIDVLVKILKQMISEKLGQRMVVLKDVEEIFEYIPKELLPSNYGGSEKSLEILSEEFIDVLSSEECKKQYKYMSLACTNESLRISTNVNDHFVGLDGTFRTLSVD